MYVWFFHTYTTNLKTMIIIRKTWKNKRLLILPENIFESKKQLEMYRKELSEKYNAGIKEITFEYIKKEN